MTYFADTSFWLALSRKRDQFSDSARAWNQFVLRARIGIVTTEAVLWEWLNALSILPDRARAVEGYRLVHSDPRIEVVPFESELVKSAVELYRTRRDKDWSLTDCLSFVVMGRRSLREALTTDHHFEQASLKALLLSEPPPAVETAALRDPGAQ